MEKRFSPKKYKENILIKRQVIITFKMPALMEHACLYFKVSLVLSMREYPVIAVLNAIIQGTNGTTLYSSMKTERNTTRTATPNTPARIEYENLPIKGAFFL